MSDQQPDDVKKTPETSLPADAKSLSETGSSADAKALPETSTSGAVSTSPDTNSVPETEWIPGEQLELIRIPPPTIWPATLALGTTGIAFGVVTHWILSLAGLFLFLLGAKGWIEDMRKDVLQ
jgi:hypothetical protein